MRNALLLIMLFVFQTGLAQESINNFFLDDNNEIYWQRVYDADVELEALLTHISSFGVVKDVQVTDNVISGVLGGVVLDYKGYGQSEMMTAIYIARSTLGGGFSVEFRDGRYRATIKNIILTQSYEDALSKAGEKTALNNYSTSRKGFKKSFSKKPSEIINYSLNKIFEYKLPSNDDW